MIDRRLFIASAAASLATPCLAQGAGWVTLFDGTSLDGWTKVGDAPIALVDGVAQADKGSGNLVWKDQLEDFELRAEVYVSEDANSGVFVRFPDKGKPSSATGYEFNVFDQRPDPSYGTGAIVNVAKAAAPVKAGGKWNTLEIICKRTELSFAINGVTTVDRAKVEKTGRGYISIQFGGGTVKFRKVEIRPL